MTQLERLLQEHAIYKAFFFQYLDQPQSIVYEIIEGKSIPVKKIEQVKSAAFNVVSRLRNLDNGIVYYDPIWANADTKLFTTDINSLKADANYTGASVFRDDPVA